MVLGLAALAAARIIAVSPLQRLGRGDLD